MKTASVSPMTQSNIEEDDYHRLRRRKRSKKIIHVTIRPRSVHQSVRLQLIKSPHSFRSVREHHDRPPILTREAWSDQKDVTVDFHRDKKKKSPLRYIAGFLVCLFVLLLITMIILLILLLKPKSTGSTTAPVGTLRWSATGITVAGTTGVLGNTSTMLNTPRGITVDYLYALYIADFGNVRVQKYSRGASNGITVAGNESESTSPNQFLGPSGVVVDNKGNLFVADLQSNRIQLWNNGATSGITVAGSSTGVSGNTSSLLYFPYAVDFDSSTSTIYVPDTYNNRIMTFTLGSLSGVTVAGGAGGGLNNTQLWLPQRCYFDSPSNSLIISNINSNNVVRWVLGDNHWTLIAGDYNATFGNTSTLFRNPRDLTLDPMGNLYVADKDNHRIQFFSAGQPNGITIAGATGISGSNSTLLNSPKSVALDHQLNLYVSDSNNHRIQKYLRY